MHTPARNTLTLMVLLALIMVAAIGCPPGGGGGGEGEGEGTPSEGEGEGTPPEGEGEGTPPEGEGEGTPPEGEGEGTPPEGEGEGTPEGEGEGVPPTNVTIDTPDSTVLVGEGLEIFYSATAPTEIVSWTTTADTVAKIIEVYQTYAYVRAFGVGVATLTATGDISDTFDTIAVTVDAPDVLAGNTVGMVGGWGPDATFPTSGNPLLGGHGPTGTDTPDITIAAAYDEHNLYMRFSWADDTQTDTERAWTYDETTGTWSSGGNEDRLYVAWPIVDGAGRQDDTFAQIGCAMLCHQRDITDSNRLVVNTLDAVDDCSVCHVNAPGTSAGSGFEHQVIGATDCAVCHTTEDRSIVTDGTTFDSADMIAPGGSAFDIWHWKAQRSNPLGIAEDQHTSDGDRRTRDEDNLAPNNETLAGGAPLVIWDHTTSGDTMLNDTDPIFGSYLTDPNWMPKFAAWNEEAGEYRNMSLVDTTYTPLDAQTVTRHILKNARVADGDASASVRAVGVYSEGVWTVQITRALGAGAEGVGVGTQFTPAVTDTDVAFNTTQVSLFSTAATDNSGITHRGVAGPLTLSFDPN